MQGVFMGHPGLYNRNQIRDKLLLVLIFFEINEVCKNDGTLEQEVPMGTD